MLKKYYKELLAALVIILLIVYLSQVDFKIVLDQVFDVGWWFGAILISTFTAYLLATKAWQLCFPNDDNSAPTFIQLFVVRQIGEALTLINPTNIVAGELSKIYLLEQSNIEKNDANVSIIVSRGLIILSFILLLIIVGFYLFFQIEEAAIRIGLFALLAFFCLIFLTLSWAMTSERLVLYHFIKRTASVLPFKNTTEKLTYQSLLLNQNIGLLFSKYRSRLSRAFILSMIHWLVGTLEFYFILNALGFECSFFTALVMESGVMIFKSIGGFVPGQIGVEEFGNKIMLDALGLPGAELWVSVSILRRARQLFWIGISLVFLFIHYKSQKWKFSF